MIDASTIFLPSIPSLQLTNWIFSVRAVTRRKENRENLWKNQSFVQKFHYTTIFLLQKENGVSLRDFRRGCSINFAARSRVLRVIAPSSYHDRSLRGGGEGFARDHGHSPPLISPHCVQITLGNKGGGYVSMYLISETNVVQIYTGLDCWEW